MQDLKPTPRGGTFDAVPAWFALAIASFTMGACSGVPAERDDLGTGLPQLASSSTSAPYPPGTARVLSMANAQSIGEDEPFAAATACYAALGAFSQALERTPFVGGEMERNAVRQAEARFLATAKREGARQGLSPGEVDSKLEERKTNALDNAAAELPRASGCLRSLIAS